MQFYQFYGLFEGCFARLGTSNWQNCIRAPINCIGLYRSCCIDPFKFGTWGAYQEWVLTLQYLHPRPKKHTLSIIFILRLDSTYSLSISNCIVCCVCWAVLLIIASLFPDQVSSRYVWTHESCNSWTTASRAFEGEQIISQFCAKDHYLGIYV